MFPTFLIPILFAFSAYAADPRLISGGSIIPDENYADQPYVVIMKDSNWLCVLTTGQGVEGRPGQHIVSTISKDKGKTWSPLIDIEPANGPEASWVMPLIVPSGRVYVFYTYNRDNLREIKSNHQNNTKRVDTMGAYMFKFSDDNGRSWSKERYEIPMRKMRIDRENYHNGEVMFFWGVGKPIIVEKPSPYAIFGFAKVGRWGQPGTMIESEGCFLRSDNILTERDPAKIRWTLLPDGDQGLRSPKGPVSDEANLVSLSDGALYATYRTIDGYNAAAYSRDRGHTWTPSAFAEYTPGGRKIKHPRAANFVRKFSNGKYLLWFHNHGGDAAHSPEWTNNPTGYYRNRNPAWILGGIERSGHIYWSQPEILLYDDDPAVRISYPDFVENGGRFFVTETQKEVARVHEIDKALLDAVWNQHTVKTVARDGLAVEWAPAKGAQLDVSAIGANFTVDLWVRFKELTAGQVLFDSKDASGKGVVLATGDRFNLTLTMHDGRQEAVAESDWGTHSGTLRTGVWQHVAVVVDAGPRIVSFIIDGEFNDGGSTRQYGWTRFPRDLGNPNGRSQATIGKGVIGELSVLRIYNRYLRTSEVVGNWHAGVPSR